MKLSFWVIKKINEMKIKIFNCFFTSHGHILTFSLYSEAHLRSQSRLLSHPNKQRPHSAPTWSTQLFQFWSSSLNWKKFCMRRHTIVLDLPHRGRLDCHIPCNRQCNQCDKDSCRCNRFHFYHYGSIINFENTGCMMFYEAQSWDIHSCSLQYLKSDNLQYSSLFRRHRCFRIFRQDQ